MNHFIRVVVGRGKSHSMGTLPMLVVMTIVFWFWKKELAESIRTRQPRTTYVNGVVRREETA